MEELVDDIIICHLRSLRPRALWRILGFGGGDCYYERSIGERLTEPSNGGSFRMYRFDPHEKPSADDVTDVDLAERVQAEGLKFDIVVCRWSLHHVPGASRWDTIANAIRMLHPAGALVIVEEGDFAWRAGRAPLNRAYQFLVACEDVLVNGILRPGFADTARTHDGSGFYLDYLASDDIVCIENYLPTQMCRHLYLPGSPDKHGEAVIIYS
jgi:SAM-dependent methyltransferase